MSKTHKPESSIGMKTIYTAHSKHNYYAKKIVSAFVLDSGLMPLNPFMNWGYFLDDLVGRDIIRKANRQLVEMSDEVWQFGEISNGCHHELLMAMERKKPIKFFTIGGTVDKIKPVTDLNDLVFEAQLAEEINVEDFRRELKKYTAK